MSQSSRRRTVLTVAVAVASLASAGPAAAQAPTPPPPAPLPPTTVTVTGTGTVKPTPLNRRDNASIAKAVARAKTAAAPLAIADGRARATNVAALNGLRLGTLLAITEGPTGASPFFFVGPYGGQDGTFGPGRYCGTIRRVVFRTDSAGKRKPVRTRAIHTCRVPTQVSVSYGMTFATTPAG
jgi:uncharacterized protein YggE